MNQLPNENSGDSPGASAVRNSRGPMAERKRLAARRRFMRMGAGGAAALMVTVVHKRAFAGGSGKKTTAIQSLCGSAAMSPDLKGANGKNALQQSAMGTPKGLVCQPTRRDSCNAANVQQSDNNHLNQFGQNVWFVKSSEFKNNGCGSLTATTNISANYRLYKQGYCPIVYTNGALTYDTTAQYYKYVNGVLTAQNCTPGSY